MELYRISKEGTAQKLEPRPFNDELTDMESFIYKHPEILGNVVILDRQVHRGGKGRMDLLALDLEEKPQIMIVELKNTLAKEDVLLQVMGYAHDQINRIDYVRAKVKDKLDASDNKVSLNQIEYIPRIVIIAPEFDAKTLTLAEYVNLDIELIRIGRYEEQNDFIVSIDVLEIPKTPRGPTGGTDWDWESYESELGVKASVIETGKSVVAQIESIIENRGWDIQPFFRKGFVSFKVGRLVFVEVDVYWSGSGCWLRIKLPKCPDDLGISNPCPDLKSRWDEYFQRWAIQIPSADFDVSKLTPYFNETASLMKL